MIFVSKVFFETGDVGVAETFRVRAGNETVPASERVNTTITVNTDCGAVDGVSTRLVSRVTCNVCHMSRDVIFSPQERVLWPRECPLRHHTGRGGQLRPQDGEAAGQSGAAPLR